MIKILAVRYPSSVDRVKNDTSHLRTVHTVDESQVKSAIGELLFNPAPLFRFNYLLVNFKNKLYIIEPSDMAKSTYNRKEVTWHPFSQLVC